MVGVDTLLDLASAGEDVDEPSGGRAQYSGATLSSDDGMLYIKCSLKRPTDLKGNHSNLGN